LKAPRENGQADAEELARTWLCMWLLIHLFPNPPNCQNQSMVCAPRSMLVNSVVEMASRAPSPPHSPRHNHHPRHARIAQAVKLGKHSVRDLECLFAACSVRLLFRMGLLARWVSLYKGFGFRFGDRLGEGRGEDLRTQEHERS
jgi:hypothetical protein